MSAVRGRRPEPRGDKPRARVPIQALIPPELHAAASRRADALGVSLNRYITRLLAHEHARELGPDEVPEWWAEADQQTPQEELPLKSA
jgi:hypothetical protein